MMAERLSVETYQQLLDRCGRLLVPLFEAGSDVLAVVSCHHSGSCARVSLATRRSCCCACHEAHRSSMPAQTPAEPAPGPAPAVANHRSAPPPALSCPPSAQRRPLTFSPLPTLCRCRGWRRSGRWVYYPLHERSCCQLLTIRLDVTKFQPNKDQVGAAPCTLHAGTRAPCTRGLLLCPCSKLRALRSVRGTGHLPGPAGEDAFPLPSPSPSSHPAAGPAKWQSPTAVHCVPIQKHGPPLLSTVHQ